MYCEGAIQSLFDELYGSRNTWSPSPSAPGWWVQKCDLPLIKMRCSSTFVLYIFAKLLSWSCRATTTPFWPTPDTHIRLKAQFRRLKPDQVDYWEGALQHLLFILFIKMIDYSSKNTWGPGPSRSRFWVPRSHSQELTKLSIEEVYKLCLKMMYHGSWCTQGPGFSRTRLQTQKWDLPLLKQGHDTT